MVRALETKFLRFWVGQEQDSVLSVAAFDWLFPPWGFGGPGRRSFADCDVYVSLSKLKHHWLAGVTMTLKNNFERDT